MCLKLCFACVYFLFKLFCYSFFEASYCNAHFPDESSIPIELKTEPVIAIKISAEIAQELSLKLSHEPMPELLHDMATALVRKSLNSALSARPHILSEDEPPVITMGIAPELPSELELPLSPEADSEPGSALDAAADIVAEIVSELKSAPSAEIAQSEQELSESPEPDSAPDILSHVAELAPQGELASEKLAKELSSLADLSEDILTEAGLESAPQTLTEEGD